MNIIIEKVENGFILISQNGNKSVFLKQTELIKKLKVELDKSSIDEMEIEEMETELDIND